METRNQNQNQTFGRGADQVQVLTKANAILQVDVKRAARLVLSGLAEPYQWSRDDAAAVVEAMERRQAQELERLEGQLANDRPSDPRDAGGRFRRW